jgi:hypothetical protein
MMVKGRRAQSQSSLLSWIVSLSSSSTVEVVHWDVVVFNVLHDPLLETLKLAGVKESALPMMGITLTHGERRLINSISISLNACPVGEMK